MNTWKKLGLIHRPLGKGMLNTHCMLPTPLVLDDCVRVFFASCDRDLRGRIYYVDLDRNDPRIILKTSSSHVLDIGKPGSFDADGVNPCSIVKHNGLLHLYYVGWQRFHDYERPYTLFSGLAISKDNGESFQRHNDQPILMPFEGETCFRTAPLVHLHENTWTMLYIGGDKFIDSKNGRKLPLYELRQINSDDGISWTSESSLIRKPNYSEGEIGFGRPFIWQEGGQTVMYLSRRLESGYYLIKGIKNPKGQWNFNNEEVIPRSKQGWDSEMICFSSIFCADNKEYLLYNGNNFGRDGFGMAIRDKPLLDA